MSVEGNIDSINKSNSSKGWLSHVQEVLQKSNQIALSPFDCNAMLNKKNEKN